MNENSLNKNILENFNTLALERFLSKKEVGIKLSISGLNNPLRLLLLQNIKKLGHNVLFVVQNEQNALRYQKDIENIFEIKAEVFPYQEVNPYEDIDRNYYVYEEQVHILDEMPPLVIAPVRSLFEMFPIKNFYNKNSFEIKKDEEINYAQLIEKLVKMGYKRATMAMDAGEFSVRGDILDIFSLSDNPYRIEFFGDTVEDIRQFDPNTQKSFNKLKSIKIYPVHKFILDENTKERFKDGLQNELKNFQDNEAMSVLYNEMVEKIDNQGYFEGIEYYQNYINKDIVPMLDYFKGYVLVYEDTLSVNSKYGLIDEEFNKSYQTELASGLRLPLDLSLGRNHVTFEVYKKEIRKFKQVGFDTFLDSENSLVDDDWANNFIEFETSLPPVLSSDISKIADYIEDAIREGAFIFVCTNYPKRFTETLNDLEIYSDNIFIIPPLTGGGGVIENAEKDKKWIFLTDKELFNKRSKDITSRKYASNKQSQEYIDSINDIKTGEYVVHSVHGIGLFRGLSKQEIDGALKDYLEIEFLGFDKLFMPAEQVNLLYRYRGSGGAKPRLSKMGGTAWETTKSKAKKEVEQIAYDLLRLYAKRKVSEGIAFEPDTTWQYEMEDAFEFVETPDQMKAIVDTKADMENTKPMDRLVCADVGFGKTEVAMRAMFKAVMSGKQAALIAPTTILALQHYQTIAERFKPFSVDVQLLSRFKTTKEKKQTIKMLAEGACDIVIGTHSLLFDIDFKDLGLLVIDEEHKFGVAHKEKLKKFRENIDILSLSATPIPRTLNMALSGLKDMSLINTPPKNRLPVKTYVGEFNETFLKNAINHELQRDGQIFFVHNRVESIYMIGDYLKKLVPNARIAIAHGQMKDTDLEKIMFDFANNEYDMLLCTTIIESGLDISNTNTIIINDADRFGLAQLYQLRGRVGRSDRQAYCFCFYKKSKELTAEAFKRLNAIKDFTSLGSGYHIALRDIEIRGVGNILGAKQHGHMVNVGFDTYCNLLEECVDEIKNSSNPYEAKKYKKHEPAIIDINAEAYIPDEWVGSYEQKMLEYKRLADVKSLSELESMVVDFKDRFSKLPDSVENLVKLIKLRLLATGINITQVRETPDNIRLYTPYTMQEWLIIKRKLEINITKYFKWIKPPKTLKATQGILLMQKDNLNFEEKFNILADLFYNVSHIILEFKSK